MFGKKNRSVSVDQSLASRIPYTRCYKEEGIIQTPDNRYTKMYLVEDIKQDKLVGFDSKTAQQRTEQLIDGFPVDVKFQFVIHNRLVDKEKYVAKMLVHPERFEENLDDYIMDYNKILVDNIDIGHNNLKKATYFVVSIKADLIDDAIARFNELDGQIQAKFNDIYGLSVKSLSLVARLKVQYTMFNPERGDFGAKCRLSGDEVGSVNFDSMRRLKMTTKDIVAPDKWNSSMKLVDYTILNENTNKQQFTRSFYINSIPAIVSSSFINDITSVSSNMVLSVVYEPLDTDLCFSEAVDRVDRNTTVSKKSKRDTVADRKSKSIITIKEQVEKNDKTYFELEALDELKKAKAAGNKLFSCTMTITLYSDSLESLDKDTELLHLSAGKFSSQINSLDMQQCQGFQSCLPLCYNTLDVPRVLDVHKLATLFPNGIQDATKKNGLNCGINGVNDNIIYINRQNNVVKTGMITGVEHSGKTYQMKHEIFNALISSPKDIIHLVTTSDDYDEFVNKLGGKIVPFGINDVFEIEPGYGLDEDDHIFKTYFLEALIGSLNISGHRNTPTETTSDVIGEESNSLLRYMKSSNGVTSEDIKTHIKEHKEDYLYFNAGLDKLDAEKYPFISQPEDTRLVLYKVSNAAEMIIMLDYLWNLTIKYRKKNTPCWIFVDPIDEVLKIPQASEYLFKYQTNTSLLQTIFTYVVQDSISLINSPITAVAFENAMQGIGYAKLLCLGPIERKNIASALNIPDALIQYVSNTEPGKGIILTSQSTLPFNDNCSELYPGTLLADLFSKKVKQIIV